MQVFTQHGRKRRLQTQLKNMHISYFEYTLVQNCNVVFQLQIFHFLDGNHFDKDHPQAVFA